MTSPDPYTDPHAAAAALVLIDVQRDFYEPDAPARIEGTMERLPAMAALVRAFRQRAQPIVHAVRLYLPDGSNVDPVRRHAVQQGARIVCPGTAGSRLAPSLLPAPIELEPDVLLDGGFQRIGPREHIMYKPRWGAFFRTELEAHLRAAGMDTVVFAGCNFPNCPRTSIYQASERDFRVVLVRDALSGVYDRGMAECDRIGVRVWDLATVTSWLAAATVPTGG